MSTRNDLERNDRKIISEMQSCQESVPSGQCSGVLIAAQFYVGNNWNEAPALNFLF